MALNRTVTNIRSVARMIMADDLRLSPLPYLVPQHGTYALHYASIKGFPSVAKMLIEAGAQVNALSTYGQTALKWAVQNGRTEVVRELLAAGADPLLEDSWGVTALMKAEEGGHHAIVEQLKVSIAAHQRDEL